jgi:AraC family transcriptional regulator of adaptative response/methylated-DNA-[protein]-cysteine methyltransferase
MHSVTQNGLPPIREMEDAHRRRDASYDGVFFVAVRTTRVFCRPSCAAPAPKRRNVRYFRSADEAERAGFRPCLRCRPQDVPGTHPAWVQDLLARLEEHPAQRVRNRDLEALGVAPERARRYFQRHYGMTFHAFARARRLRGALEDLRRGTDLDQVALSHGFESHSGFRDAFVRTVGRPPGQSRATTCVTLVWLESPLGPLVAGATDHGVCLLEFSDRRALESELEELRRRIGPALPGSHPLLDQLQRELGEYFAGGRREFTVPLLYPGTPFQQKVWERLRAIPFGQTITYEQLAWAVGAPGGQRAVGSANGHNRLAILVPCHRVVNKNGKLGGYGGGLWRKQALLDLERGVSTSLQDARVG